MYTRSYFKDETESPKPPENYSGIALTEDEEPESTSTGANPWEKAEEAPVMKTESRSAFSDLLFGGRLSGLFKGHCGAGGLLGGIGSEEILIIAMALFLLLSKDGDKECAIMLLILLIL